MKFFSLITQGDVHLEGESKVLRKEDFSTLQTASEIVEKAKEEAEALLQRTEKKCKKLKKMAQEEGFEEGLLRFNQHILYFEKELKKLRHETQQAMLPLVVQAAKKVVGTQLKLHPETIVDIVMAALTPVTQNHKITIFVSKKDKEILEKEKDRIKEILEQLESLQVKEREGIQEGGCIIETETGIINATLENQWRSIEAAFDQYMKKKSHET